MASHCGVEAITTERFPMLLIAVVLIVLWLLGLITAYTMGGLLHILLVVAVIMLVINLLGRRGTS